MAPKMEEKNSQLVSTRIEVGQLPTWVTDLSLEEKRRLLELLSLENLRNKDVSNRVNRLSEEERHRIFDALVKNELKESNNRDTELAKKIIEEMERHNGGISGNKRITDSMTYLIAVVFIVSLSIAYVWVRNH